MHPVATNDPVAVEREVVAACRAMFPDGDASFVPKAFGWANEFFTGKYPGYLAVDTKYHNFEHTLQGTLCLARLLAGRQRAAATPALPQKSFELAIMAILLHDSGYLKKQGDTHGTGAKYTATHVRRSADFAAEFLGRQKFADEDVLAVQNMIFCTGVNAPLDRIPFQSEEEKITGFALASADLLGQMAEEDYADRLPMLYAEFEEASQSDPNRSGTAGMFSSLDELVQKTPAFWEDYVIPKLQRDFRGLYRFLSNPYPDGPNGYVDRIQANIEKLRRRTVAA